MFPCYLSPLMYSSVIALLPATSHYSLPWASYQQIFLRLHETFLASNPTQVSTWVEELGSCWSLLGSSKTKSWDLSESLGDAAEPLPWVSAAERDFVLVFYSLVQPTPLNLFSGVHPMISLQKYSPHGIMAG